MLNDSDISATRRGIVFTASGLVGSLAGCSAFQGEDSHSSHAVAGSNGTPAWADNVLKEPGILTLRSDGDRAPIKLEASEDSDDEPSRPHREDLVLNHTIIDSAAAGEQLVSTVDEDADSVSDFLSRTDFDAESLYLETSHVPDCFRLRLCRIAWSSERVKTDYTRVLRDYDEHCSADRRVYESRLITIPAPLDADSVSGYGSSVTASGTCSGNGPRGHYEHSGGGSESQPGRTQPEVVE